MRLLPKITSFLLLILLPVLALLSYEQIQKEKKVLYSFLDKQGEVLKTTISAGIIEPILINDYPIIDTYLGYVMNDYDTMYYLEIEKNDEIMSSVRNSKLKNDSHKYFTHDIKLYGNAIATLNFALSTKNTDEAIKQRIIDYLIIIFIAALILFLSLLFVIRKYLLEYINLLKNHTKIIGHGDYSKTLVINTKDEFHDLANSINDMTKNIYLSSERSQLLTKKLEKQKKELIFANKSKDMFLANMSHELKTPLNSINIISSVMRKNKEENLSDKQIENLHIINNCGQQLLYLINDILDISKIESGEIVLNLQTFNIKDTINDIKSMIEPIAIEKNINFVVTIEDKIDLIYSDENRIKQIIKNLLSNSLKFCPNGNIKLEVLDQEEKIKINVIDDGIGIEKNKLSHIFDRFKQVDDSITRKFGGTGLGLSISKELATLLKGKLTVKSELNKGSTFTLIIPKNKSKIEKLDNKIEVKTTKNTKEKILILNDNPVDLMKLIINLNKFFEVKNIASANKIDKNSLKDFKYLLVNSSLKNLELIEDLDIKKVLVCDDENSLDSNLKAKIVKVFKKDDSDNIISFLRS